jgi:hypothetical protein
MHLQRLAADKQNIDNNSNKLPARNTTLRRKNTWAVRESVGSVSRGDVSFTLLSEDEPQRTSPDKSVNVFIELLTLFQTARARMRSSQRESKQTRIGMESDGYEDFDNK